jgi:putative FmdB family regulatory protein
MPIYAYRCEHCGFQKDALQKVSDPPLVDCPSCGQPKLAKQLTAAGFALKGSGWYVTDFRDSGKKTASDSKSTEAATPAAAASSSESASASSSATPTATSSATPSA